MKILVVDVGGTNLKLLCSGQSEPLKIPSGPALTGPGMVSAVKQATEGWDYEMISIGYPGPVSRQGKILAEPVNLGVGWMHCDFSAEFGHPVKIINDAAMQALGSYRGGTMLFLGLGTGLGTSLVVEGTVVPMELAHLGYKKATFEDYLGVEGLHEVGKKKWTRYVHDVVEELQQVFIPDEIVLGGGNTKKLKEIPPGCRAVNNRNAFIGGFRLWDPTWPEEGSPSTEAPQSPEDEEQA